MVGEEGTSNGDKVDEGVLFLKGGLDCGGFGFGTGNDCGDGSSGASEGFRTYKRRKQTRSISVTRVQEDGRGSVEAASKLDNQTIKNPPDNPPGSCASLNGSNDTYRAQCRELVLEDMYRSLIGDDGGIQGCIIEALMKTAKESDSWEKGECKFFSQRGWMPNGFNYTARGHVGVESDRTFGEANHHSVTEMCQHAFRDIILSEKFTSLCQLLFENFHQGVKTENLFSLSLMNKRMKEGVYEHSPVLFSEDIQQVWRKVHIIGTELISLAKNLSDLSRTCYNKQVGGSAHFTSQVGMDQFSRLEADFRGKVEQTEAQGVYKVSRCRNCGAKADGVDCLVCNSCEDMYHISCIQPAAKEIPPTWCCTNCTACGMEVSHENCSVCKRLNGPQAQFKPDVKKISSMNKAKVNGPEESSHEVEDELQTSTGDKRVGLCKVCGSAVENGGRLMICDHPYCPHQYYHVQCLSMNQLKSYGPRWYCPSCLCRVCLTDRDDDKIVLCDGCDHAYHLYCMRPKLSSIPKGKWFCRHCHMNIQEIHRVKRECAKLESKLRRKEERVRRKACMQEHEVGTFEKRNGKHEEADKGREGMDMLLNAALNYEAKLAANQPNS